MIPGEQADNNLGEMVAGVRTAFWRYWKLALAPAIVVGSLIALVGLRLPSYFCTDLVLMLQPQRISSKLLERDKQDDMSERLDGLVKEILSRQRLRSIIETKNIYPDLSGVLGKEEAIKRFRKNLEVGSVQSSVGGKSLETFRLQFSHEDPKKTYEVTKALSTLFIDESTVAQRSEVQGKKEFFEGALEASRKELEKTEGLVQEFTKENFGRLPEHLPQAEARLRSAQAQLESNSTQLAAYSERRKYLETELTMVGKTGGAEGGMAAGGAGPEESIEQLRSALEVMRTKYSDKHPDVVTTRARIEAIEKRMEGGVGSKRPVSTFRPGESQAARGLRADLNALDVDAKKLTEENRLLKASIEKLTRDVEIMPLKDQELTKIRRDYANSRAKYEELLKARDEASLQSSLVQSQRGAQFRIIEEPQMPVQPAGPNRLMFFGLGIAAAFAVFFMVPVVLFFLSSSYKFRSQVESDLDIEVLGVVPPMATRSTLTEQRQLYLTTVGLSLVTLTCGAVLIVLSI